MKVKINDTTVVGVLKLEKNQKGLCCLDINCLPLRENEDDDNPLCNRCIFHDDHNIFYINMDKLEIIK